MSKHDLKGVDTRKVGNNKYVNYTFKDYMEDQGLSRKGALKTLGPNVKLSDLQVIAPTLEQPKTVGGKVAQFLGLGTDPNTTETEVIGGKVVGARRPDNIISRPLAGLLDFTTFGILDTDQRGGLFGGKHSGSGYGGRQDLDYMLPKAMRDQLAKADEPKKEDKGSTNPYGDLDKLLDYQLKYKKAADIMDRKGRAVDSAMGFANLRTQMPFYMNQLKDLTTFKQQQLLDSELVKQSMPDAREARKLSSASRFAGELGAVSDAYAKAGTVAQGGIRNPTATFSV